jgi:hypothetical protein
MSKLDRTPRTYAKTKAEFAPNYVKIWVPHMRGHLLLRSFVAAEERDVLDEVDGIIALNTDARAAVYTQCTGALKALPVVGEFGEYPARPKVTTEGLMPRTIRYMRLIADGYPHERRAKLERNLEARGLLRFVDGHAELTLAAVEYLEQLGAVEQAPACPPELLQDEEAA